MAAPIDYCLRGAVPPQFPRSHSLTHTRAVGRPSFLLLPSLLPSFLCTAFHSIRIPLTPAAAKVPSPSPSPAPPRPPFPAAPSSFFPSCHCQDDLVGPPQLSQRAALLPRLPRPLHRRRRRGRPAGDLDFFTSAGPSDFGGRGSLSLTWPPPGAQTDRRTSGQPLLALFPSLF